MQFGKGAHSLFIDDIMIPLRAQMPLDTVLSKPTLLGRACGMCRVTLQSFVCPDVGVHVCAKTASKYILLMYSSKFIFCIRAFTARSQTEHHRLGISWPFVYASVLFIMGTIHVCFSLYRALDAFAYYKGAGGVVSMLSRLFSTVCIVHVSSASFTGGVCICIM